MKKLSKYILELLALSLIIAWSIYLLVKGPEQVINTIGLHNSYLIAFISSFLGGMSALSFISVYPLIGILAIGKMNPLTLGFISSLGLSLSDITFFYIGVRGRTIAKKHSSKFKERTKKIINWVKNKPTWFTPIFIWAYIGLTPFPNNLLTAVGGLIKFKFKHLVIPLLLGNLFLLTAIAYAASHGLK